MAGVSAGGTVNKLVEDEIRRGKVGVQDGGQLSKGLVKT